MIKHRMVAFAVMLVLVVMLLSSAITASASGRVSAQCGRWSGGRYYGLSASVDWSTTGLRAPRFETSWVNGFMVGFHHVTTRNTGASVLGTAVLINGIFQMEWGFPTPWGFAAVIRYDVPVSCSQKL